LRDSLSLIMVPETMEIGSCRLDAFNLAMGEKIGRQWRRTVTHDQKIVQIQHFQGREHQNVCLRAILG